MNELRQTALSEVEIVAAKSRFGLFSQPPPLAIGDDSLFRTKQGSYLFIQLDEVKTESLFLNQGTCSLVPIDQEWIEKGLLILPKASTPAINISILKKWTTYTIKNSIRDLKSTRGSSSLRVASTKRQSCPTSILTKNLCLKKGQREMRRAE